MQHDVDKLVYDALSAANDIRQFVGEQTYDEYHANKLVRAAVERKFEIIAEALNRISRISPETTASIREFKKILAFRIWSSMGTTWYPTPWSGMSSCTSFLY